VIEDVVVDLPCRDDPLARRVLPRANEMLAHLFALLHLDDPDD
jgi:hypothetical protein